MPDKQQVRQALLVRRSAIPPEVRRAKSRMVTDRILGLEEFLNARTVLLFASFRSEIDTAQLIDAALAAGKRVVLPLVAAATKSLRLVEVRGRDELAAGYQGIPEPAGLSEERDVAFGTVDAVVIPGAGYDLAGNRIGYGGGYYDRLLGTPGGRPVVIAPAFEEQIVEGAIPAEPHDCSVDIIVTDRRVVRCSAS